MKSIMNSRILARQLLPRRVPVLPGTQSLFATTSHHAQSLFANAEHDAPSHESHPITENATVSTNSQDHEPPFKLREYVQLHHQLAVQQIDNTSISLTKFEVKTEAAIAKTEAAIAKLEADLKHTQVKLAATGPWAIVRKRFVFVGFALLGTGVSGAAGYYLHAGGYL